MSDECSLNLGNTKLSIPLIKGTKDEIALDISKLRKETGKVTLDVGYVNTAACKSEITFLNGEQGVLEYRGYPIEELANKASFLETSYLLYHGQLPNKNQLNEFTANVADNGKLDPRLSKLINAMSPAAHPMGSLGAAFFALAGFYPELAKEDLSLEEKEKVFTFLMGQTKSIVAQIFRHSQNKAQTVSDPQASFATDFLKMMFPEKSKTWSKEVFAAMDVLCILHADHEQNCSTTTVRTIGSAKGNMFASLAGGVGALWGSLHGGANQAVIEMLESIDADGGDVEKYIARAKDKNDSFKIMGFGHRVYKNFDPRAKIIKQYCEQILNLLNISDPLLDIAKKLETAALEDEYFIKRKLYPNVDFYSGLIYRALGIPSKFYTTLFALGRLPGWMAQWKEQRTAEGLRITRPRQIYTGELKRDFTPISDR
jgi:citrate synthase